MNKLFSFIKEKIFRKKEKDSKEYRKTKSLFDMNIYCEIIWNRNKEDRIELYGYNGFQDLREFCGELYNYSIIHTNNPIKGIFIPKIIYGIDWNYIFRRGISLKEFKITFTNYSNGPKNYSVILETINSFGIKVIDTFTSTSKVFIDPYELTDNIDKFFKYAQDYGLKK